MRRRASLALIVHLIGTGLIARADDERSPALASHVLPLLKSRCVKCHGPIKREGGLNLGTARGLAAGGESGLVVDRAEPLKSLLWRRVEEGEMPPDEALAADERETIRRWLTAGAEGLPDARAHGEQTGHWAFEPASQPPVPQPGASSPSSTPLDCFLQTALRSQGLSFSPEADRYVLIRRLSFDLLGLPPTPDEIEDFVHDTRPDAYERVVDRYLASPRYGERWGKHWLDAAGYADSNGYFNADTDRPLAYRYRDYVVDSLNRDKPFDQFVREQLAGDELAGYRAGSEIAAEQVELLVATHFLRNSQDGTGESDGNPDEVRADRYSVLEGTQQIIGSALLGLTLQCARCHDHKFEPVTQVDYYRLQAVLAGAFDPENWLKPNERQVITASQTEMAAWEARMRDIDDRIAVLRRELTEWVRARRPRGQVVFEDHFDAGDDLSSRWTNVAPGDDVSGGSPAVRLGSTTAPGAVVENGALSLVESGGAGNRWLSTSGSFGWAPSEPGETVQVTFDLVADKVQATDQPAARIGFYIALNDFNDNSGSPGGNILVDGNPQGGAEVHVDYPGDDSRAKGQIGTSGYHPGHNYGVRITNAGDGRYLLEQLVDDVPEEKTVTLGKEDLPPGGFGFEFCCGRSFVVDNVVIESSSKAEASAEAAAAYAAEYKKKRKEVEAAVADLNGGRSDQPGKTAVALDVSPTPPEWFLLVRGNYSQRGAKVEPGVPAVLEEPGNIYSVLPASASESSGRRLALAHWLTRPDSRAAALLARVTVNRLWQHHFGAGICSTPDNLGYSGSAPSHPELLDYLVGEFLRGGWRMKPLHRTIVVSRAYRQSSSPREEGLKLDPDNRLLWRFPLRRLEAESLRDAALSLSGELDGSMGGAYVPTDRNGQGEIVVDEAKPGGRRRSLYLQQRRTQTLSLLELFDTPSIVTNCTRRSSATTALQSLSALNSEFALARARALAGRLAGESPGATVDRAFMLTAGRPPDAKERAASERFLLEQRGRYAEDPDAASRALVDFCQMLLASSSFLYIE
ncbi:MAG TPA: PSD1 and planctomycete cytochrome C domain-containing protein [Pirellulales bacterium]|nr:PSD1 and planctomycete cytochrome C domain-containing protein [Pirellulales bacterium]